MKVIWAVLLMTLLSLPIFAQSDKLDDLLPVPSGLSLSVSGIRATYHDGEEIRLTITLHNDTRHWLNLGGEAGAFPYDIQIHSEAGDIPATTVEGCMSWLGGDCRPIDSGHSLVSYLAPMSEEKVDLELNHYYQLVPSNVYTVIVSKPLVHMFDPGNEGPLFYEGPVTRLMPIVAAPLRFVIQK